MSMGLGEWSRAAEDRRLWPTMTADVPRGAATDRRQVIVILYLNLLDTIMSRRIVSV